MMSFNTSKLGTTQLWHQLYIDHTLFVQSFIASLGNLKFQDDLSKFLPWEISAEEITVLSGEGSGEGSSLDWKRESCFFLSDLLSLVLSFLRCLTLGMILV